MLDERLRIAIFSDSAFPVLNGVSVSIDMLIRQLRDAGHSVHLFTPGPRGYKDPDPNTYRFFAIETPWVRDYPLAMPPFYGMLRKFRRHEFDLVHTHTPFTVGFVGMRWAQSHGIPIVSTYHTLYDRYAHYIPYLPRRYVRFKMAKHTSFYYNNVDQVIVPSQAAARWLRRHSVYAPMSVVPTGAPKRAMFDRSEVRRKLGVLPEQKMLLYVGRIAREKNLAVVFEMAREVFAMEPTARLWLVGDGPDRGRLSELARTLGIGDRVTFAGFVPRQEVDPYYVAADLFVFGSITETQGLVVQEAMAYGLPSVVVGGGGASEAVDDGVNGIVVRNEPAQFADRVLSVLGDDALHARLSGEAARSVRGQSPSQMLADVVSVYRQAIAMHSAETVGESGLVRA